MVFFNEWSDLEPQWFSIYNYNPRNAMQGALTKFSMLELLLTS